MSAMCGNGDAQGGMVAAGGRMSDDWRDVFKAWDKAGEMYRDRMRIYASTSGNAGMSDEALEILQALVYLRKKKDYKALAEIKELFDELWPSTKSEACSDEAVSTELQGSLF